MATPPPPAPSTTPTTQQDPPVPPPLPSAATAECRRCASYLASALLGTSGGGGNGGGSGNGGGGKNGVNPPESVHSGDSRSGSGGRSGSGSGDNYRGSAGSGPETLLRAMGATAYMVRDGISGGGGPAEAVVTIPVGGGRRLGGTTRSSRAARTSGGVAVRRQQQSGGATPAAVAGEHGQPGTEPTRMTRDVQAQQQQVQQGPPEIVEIDDSDHRAPPNGGLLSSLRRRITSSSSSPSSSPSSSSSFPAADATIRERSTSDAVATSALPTRRNQPVNPNSTPTSDDDQPISVSITCQPCGTTGPEGGARAYVKGPHPLSVVLCSNRLKSPAEINEVLIHELTHVYDVRVRGLDLRDCTQLAYSEVRAAREAECSGSLTKFTERMCVRERAGVATNNMFPGKVGRDCVKSVFERAMADRAPFDGDGNGKRGGGGGWDGCGFGVGRKGGGKGGGGGGSDSNGGGGGSDTCNNGEGKSGIGAKKADGRGGGGEQDEFAVSSRRDGSGGSIFGRDYSSAYGSLSSSSSSSRLKGGEERRKE